MVNFIFTAGPLGSGKTTFINAIAPGLEKTNRIGAAISDLGVINDDARRVKIKGDVAGFKAGCVCCERRQDLEKLIKGIDSDFDYFLVEPSGASNVYDMIQVVQEAQASTRPDFLVSNVFTMVPVANWEQVKSLRALKAGVQTASSVVLTKTSSGDLGQVNYALDNLGATKSRFIYDGEPKDLSYMLSELPKWKEPLIEIGRGHEHFNKISFSIPPNAKREEVVQKLEQLKELGVARSKGIVPSQGFEFDLSYGDISTSKYDGNQVAARGTVIFEGLKNISPNLYSKLKSLNDDSLSFSGFQTLQEDSTEKIINIINSFDVGGAADVNHSVSEATIEDLLKTFHYHYKFTEKTSPFLEGRVRANFEGTDDAYTLGKEIYLRTGGEESSPLEMALSPYLQVRSEGLEALEKLNQPDKSYVGVMLGSYMIQMIGEKDNVPFDKLTEGKWIQNIKENAAPTYFKHLSNFGKSDLKYFASNDKHFPFFTWMAERAAPYVDKNLVKAGAENMAIVHNNELSQRWRKLANE